MASAAPDSAQTLGDDSGWRAFFARWVVLGVWLPIVVIGVLHYGTGAQHHWVHDILRRAYYLPIVVAALLLGLRGGLVAALVVSLTYVPHAFLSPVHFDPAHGLEKVLELVLYHVVGGVAGTLAGLERRRRVELQRAIDEQQRLTGQLVRAGRLSALGEVVAGMAHEIKNPLHALAGTAEVVDPLIHQDAEERPLWELHRAEIARLGRVADRFLSFANPSPPTMGPVDLRDVASRLVALVEADARQKSIQLEHTLPDAPVLVSGDRDQLAQVAMNIVINGFKALGDKGDAREMHISVGRAERNSEPTAFLRLENNGPEIEEGVLDNIFDPFHSGDDTGTGLGLSISYRIVDQHGGYIDVENAGLGVAFTVTLPLLQAD